MLKPLLSRFNRSNYKEYFRYAGAVLQLVRETAPAGVMAGAAAVMAASSLMAPLSLYLLKRTIDAVQGAMGNPPANIRPAALMLGLTAAAAIFEMILAAVLRLIRHKQTLATVDAVNERLLEKSVALDLSFFESSSYYDKLHRAQTEAGHRLGLVFEGLLHLLVNLGTTIAVSALVLSTCWPVALVLAAAAVPTFFLSLKHSRLLYLWMKSRTTQNRQAFYYQSLLTGDHYAKEVRAYGLGRLFRERYRNLREILREERHKVEKRRVRALLGAQGIAAATEYLVFGYLAYTAVRGTATVGDLFLYFTALRRVQTALGTVMTGASAFFENLLFLRTLFEFLGLSPQVAEPDDPLPVPRPMQRGIRFENVGFTYPNEDLPVLCHIDITIPPRKIVALVGANGAGKTTLVKLLCRLHDPCEGAVTLDGIDLRRFSSAELRRQFSYVFQDFVAYQAPARENIWFGDIGCDKSHPAVAEAARKAGADAFLSRLPENLDTLLGSWFEGGRQLSKGQWQRVALARALMRDAQIVVLDEPTSALDVASEEAFYTLFRQNLGSKSAVLVSHRFSSVRMADYIYVLDESTICEEGTHEALIRKNGIYAGMYNTHARQYEIRV